MIIAVILLLFFFGVSYKDGPDYKNYELLYNSYSESNGSEIYQNDIEIGYQLIQFLANSSHLSFDIFLLLIFAFYFAVIYYLYKKFNWPWYSLLVYALFPYLLDVIQLRNTIACGFLYLALANLKRRWVAILYFLLASAFQKVFVFYTAIYVLQILLKLPVRILISVIFISIISLVLYLNLEQIDSPYTNTHTSLITRIFFFGQFVFLFYMLLSLPAKLIDHKLAVFIKLCLPSIFLVFFNVEFFRVVRNLLVYIYPIALTNSKYRVPIVILSISDFIFFVLIPGFDFILEPFLHSIWRIYG